MANRPFDLPETKGSFQLQGAVQGVERDNFFKEQLTKTNKKMRFSKFGIKTSEENAIYLDLNGMVRDFVYFGKKNKDTGKYETKKVPWAQRNDFKEEGYRMYGVNIGIEQYIDEAGKKQNKKVVMPEYDACGYVAENLKDDAEVFVRGKIEFSSFTNDKGEVSRSTKFVPNQISSLKSPIDFTSEDYVEKNDFTQTIIFMDINLDDTDPEDKKGLLQAKIVNYSTIEDVEFVVRNNSLFKTLKKNLKPYNTIQVHGKVINKALTEEVETGDTWGEENPMNQVNRVYIRELEIKGANPDSVDTETYTKDNIEEAIRALREFGETGKPTTTTNTTKSEDWGSTKASTTEENWDEEEW